MAQDTFVHLHNHSDYSLLDGAMKTTALVERAVAYGCPAVALTDHGNMFGAVEFYLACRDRGIKPIVGMEAYVVPDHACRDRTPENRPHHTVLLARDLTGWRNLMRLSSLGYLEGFYGKPRIDKAQLDAHREGLIALSACLSGEPNRALRHGDEAAAVRAAAEYREILGRDNYFLEIQDHGLDDEARVRRLMPKVAREVGVGLVATNDAHYLERDHAEAHDLLLCIGTNRQYDDPGRWRYETDQIYLKSPAEMLELFRDWPEACENTLAIAERIDLELPLGKLLLPEFPLPDGFDTPEAYLEHLAREGLHRRYGTVDAALEERFRYEMDIIRRTGYAGYFLIVWDFIHASRRMGIPVGPGRGSAAGSLVCYCLGITEIDPIANQLLFERFLNPERVSMPDIDVDFCFEQRPRIIQYVVEKYGQENVSQIITFGTMAARAVIKDVARVLGFSFAEADKVSKLVPEGVGVSLKEVVKEVPEFARLRKESPRHDMLIRNALVLEGLARNPGIHAAGVLITPSPLIEHIPLYRSPKGDVTSQFDMRMVERMGLLKMDFLGLRTLTVIDKALRLVERTTGRRLEPRDIPLDDPETFALLQRGETVGVFQLESSGMQELLRKLKPEVFGDIVAVNALYRPGPLESGMADVFVACKNGRQAVRYPHPDLQPILEETYGVILYQEQVMQIASRMGGFSMGQADILRKAMGKKNEAMMARMRVEFLAGAVERGYDERLAAEIFDTMAQFAKYGFNKSHSASYAVLSIQTAWLKAHYPAQFLAATMTTEMRKADRITELIDEVKRLGLRIGPPNVNRASVEFDVAEDGGILFGMGAVKNVGQKAIAEIRRAREELGRDFTDLFDFCAHVDLSAVNRKVIESLIDAGAMDDLAGHRRQMLENLDRALQYGNRLARERLQGQASLFGGGGDGGAAMAAPTLTDCPPHDPLEQLSRERQAVGFFLSGHPFHEYREFLDDLPVTTTRDVAGCGENAWVQLAGVITSRTETHDRHKRLYARCHFEDRRGLLDLTVYADLFAETAELVRSDRILLVGGRVRVRGDGRREVVAETIVPVDTALAAWTREAVLELDLDAAAAADAPLDRELSALLAADAGERPAVPVTVILHRNSERWVVRSRGRGLALTLDVLRRLRRLPGLRRLRLRTTVPAARPGGYRNGRGRQREARAG